MRDEINFDDTSFDFGALAPEPAAVAEPDPRQKYLDAVALCAASNNTFAQDLARKSRKWVLSEKQSYWLFKLADEERAKRDPASAAKTPEAPTVFFANIVGFLKAAQSRRPNGRLPKVGFSLASGAKVVIKLAGPTSKYVGSAHVSDGGPYGANVWYGTIAPDGAWRPSRNATSEVSAVLDGFNEDPAGYADAEGRRTGFCCFCGRELSDEREGGSLDRGYGPICARNYGLPHSGN